MDIDPADGRVSFQLKAGVLFRGFYSEIAPIRRPYYWIVANRGKLWNDSGERREPSRKLSTVDSRANISPRVSRDIVRGLETGVDDSRSNGRPARDIKEYHRGPENRRVAIDSLFDGWANYRVARRVRRKSSAGTWSHRRKCQVNCRRIMRRGRKVALL